MRQIIPTVNVAGAPGWWNGRHSRLKSGGRKACGFDSRPGHPAAAVSSYLIVTAKPATSVYAWSLILSCIPPSSAVIRSASGSS
jgi:hypothetical protein